MKFFSASRILGTVALLLFALPAMAQTPVGVWRTIDDDDGEPKSHVRIYERNGMLFGDIETLLPEGRVCTPCADEYEGSDMRGVTIMWDMEVNDDGDEWSGGHIKDPSSGRTYRCKMELDGPNRLRVRGFLGISLLGRTQVWE
ncbi:MAG: DUF2147 domain-containing protein, partial [Rubricoccaceae bacterium]|nr:DUF2147 domain-containing protein [Rubricoccaceae bacterium]